MSGKKKGKWGIVSFVGTLLAAVLVIVAVLALAGKCKNEPDAPLPEVPKAVQVEFDKQGIVFGGGSASAGQVSTPDPDPAPALPEGAFTLSAEELRYLPGETVKREITASAADVKWSAAWADPSSEWARGKAVTDYVRLVPSGKTVSVEFLAPFGERIKIVCSNESGKRECFCDCVKTVKSFSGYLSVVVQQEINPHFYSDHFSFSGVGLVNDPYTPKMEECEFEAYTLDQTLGLDLSRSTYTLTQEFIDSFRTFALAQEQATEAIRAKVNALSTETSAPMIATDPSDGMKMLFGDSPETLFNWTFPLLTDDLDYSKEGESTAMAKIFSSWLKTGGNKDIEIIDAKYFFEGSVNDYVFESKQVYRED